MEGLETQAHEPGREVVRAGCLELDAPRAARQVLVEARRRPFRNGAEEDQGEARRRRIGDAQQHGPGAGRRRQRLSLLDEDGPPIAQHRRRPQGRGQGLDANLRSPDQIVVEVRGCGIQMQLDQRTGRGLLAILVRAVEIEDPAPHLTETRREFGVGGHVALAESGSHQTGFAMTMVERGVLVGEYSSEPRAPDPGMAAWERAEQWAPG